ncbi:hypothetical protein [Agromyces seonyuensis]|uniref:Uncharacterized protein n=1 Tax=Agromyces seonyuensis TaxID=2662446 RepID=A0A6I4P5D9_9MICO|nr:hypothetical protein [Agromyces seonyuensis]MWC00246.1 hypothetical protein [Agromyces seonyuensis]
MTTDLLVRSIATLLSIGEVPPPVGELGEIHGFVRDHRAGNAPTIHEIWTSAYAGCWETWSPEFAERRIYNPVDGVLVTEKGRRDELPVTPGQKRSFPPAVQLAFPLRLPIWGRQPIDTWRMTEASSSGMETTIELRRLHGEKDTGKLLLHESGLPRALQTPDRTLELLEWEPLFAHPDFWWGANRA